MKKYYIANGIIFVIGAAACFVGFLNEGFRSIAFDGPTKVIVQRPESSYQHFKTYTTAKPFKNAEIDVNETKIYIQKGNKYQVEYRTNQEIKDFKIKNQTLKITGEDSRFGYFGNDKSELTIVVPNLNALRDLKIKTGSDENLKLEDLSLEKLKINNRYQKVTLNNVSVSKETKLKTENFDIEDCNLNNFDIDSELIYEAVITNSTISNFKFKSREGIKIKAMNSKFLGKNKFDMNYDVSVNMQNSEIHNLECRSEDIMASFFKCHFYGDNRFDSDSGKLEFKEINRDLTYQFFADSKNIDLYGKKIKDDFDQENSKNNSLQLKGDSVKAVFK
ncbi:DUF4097 family beta strand repeat-containing protein [Xylocopilactobacillus apis]|uniref:Adhesin domain-containing protein n=1 Tax=Xylocopilactobacillus apis TaxID=2932183 RepID=A0AAU9CWE8_9LACO|nr:DUF4097 family beta strand repeat-containing protein [Xylocopilactobacillus apis]BDR55603.1 hypothetical protein KIMC2_01650 [Xylocopilactobacillus apis]